MERNNNPTGKILPLPILLAAAALLLVAIAVYVRFGYSRAKPPENVSLSQVAAGIVSGSIVKIEDRLALGEFTVQYQDGHIEKGARDPNAPLLEQLSLLGVQPEQFAGVRYEIVKSANTFNSNPLGLLIVFGLVGIPAYVAIQMSKRERMGRRDYRQTNIPSVRFKDVAGLDENVQELQDIVTFLKDGDKFAALGAHMPRGVLMVGDPGTGKTLIAKAVAGEAGVPFFAISGSEFVEVYVGVGASRIRSLFDKARKKAPCIIFIDEIDAVGRERHRSESGAEMEADQTLNQLLVEMDGFSSGESIVVLAATNRLDVLDSALTRPGRFDRRVHVYRPDVKGRAAILNIHAQGKKLAADVNLEAIARATPGLVGADLANIVNEAAIVAVRNRRSEIGMSDLEEAVEKNIAGGAQRTNRVISADERKIVAYHEAGHAVVMHLTPGSDPVHKITIIPRGQAGGYTMALPEEESLLMSRSKFLARITGLLGGRAAEEIFFNDITSGASNDLTVATQLAEEMVMRLGMERGVGLRVFPASQGIAAIAAPRTSQKTFEVLDEAVHNILESCYAEACQIMETQRRAVECLADTLLDLETLHREQFVELLGREICPALPGD